jgi:hypothetical protein
MKGVLVDDTAKVHSEPSEISLTITTLTKGDVFELVKKKKNRHGSWYQVILASGQVGYLRGGTQIYAQRQARVFRKTLDLYESPDDQSPVILTLLPKEIIQLSGVEKNGDEVWVHAVTSDGISGYFPGKTVVRIIPESKQGSARKSLLGGGILILAGATFTLIQHGQILIINLILFAIGVFLVVSGLFELRKTSE